MSAQLQALVPDLMRDDDRLGIVFWDETRQRLTTILEPSPNKEATLRALAQAGGIRTFETSQTGVEDTRSPEALMREAMEAANAAGARLDVDGHVESTKRFAAEAELARFRRKTSAMARLVASMASTPGRKIVVYLSNTFRMPSGSGARLSAGLMIDNLAKTANASGVTFYAMRPVVPDPGRPDPEGAASDPLGSSAFELDRHLEALGRVTAATGGVLDFGLQSVSVVGDALVKDLSSYYSIAYRARSDGRDRERSISVNAKNPDHRVRVRRSFVEKSSETLARETVRDRLFGGSGGTDLQFQFAAGAARSRSRGRWIVPIDIRVPAAQLQYGVEGKDRVALLQILIVAANGVAEVNDVTADNLRVVAGTNDRGGCVRYSAELLADQKGSEIAIGVYDRRSGLLGIRTFAIRPR